MSFKYINPGYAGLLQNQNPSYKANVVNATGKSKTGKAFTCRQFNFFKIPSTLANDEIWLKCDAYITKKRSLYFGEGYGTNSLQNGVNFSMGDSSFSLYIWYSHYSSQLTSIYYTDDIAAETGLKLDAINSIWLHIKYGDAGTGFLELQINNKRFDKKPKAIAKAMAEKTTARPTPIVAIVLKKRSLCEFNFARRMDNFNRNRYDFQ